MKRDTLIIMAAAGIFLAGSAGCGGRRGASPEVPPKGPMASMTDVHILEAHGASLAWEGWIARADVTGDAQQVSWTTFHIQAGAAGGGQWCVDGTAGSWNPDTRTMTSEETVSIVGPGIRAEGRNVRVDMGAQTIRIGSRPTASVDGVWLREQ